MSVAVEELLLSQFAAMTEDDKEVGRLLRAFRSAIQSRCHDIAENDELLP